MIKKNSIDLKNGTTPLKGIIDVFQLNLIKLYLHSNSQRITKKKIMFLKLYPNHQLIKGRNIKSKQNFTENFLHFCNESVGS